MNNIRQAVVAVLAGSAGVGGTQKAAALLAGGLARRGYGVYYLCDGGGPWADYVAAQGVRLVPLKVGTSGPLRDFLCDVRPDILHQHVPGTAFGNPVYPALLAMSPGPRPALIETNVFGRLEDPEADQWVVRRMFVSRSSCVQAFQRSARSLSLDALGESAVLPNPVLSASPLNAERREAVRTELGIGADELLAIRLGRPDPGKWTDWECRAFERARRRDSRLRLLLMEPPEWLRKRIQTGKLGSGIITLPVTADVVRLDEIYGSADLMIHAPFFGESFGYTIAEAMAASLPVITITTPYGDNAQVELVENGCTGWVCRSLRETARCWGALACEPRQRREWGEAGRQRIAQLAGLEGSLDVLEAVFEEALTNTAHPVLAEQRNQLMEFARDFPAREARVSEGAGNRGRIRSRLYAAYRFSRSGLRRSVSRHIFPGKIHAGLSSSLAPAVVTLNEPVRLMVLADGSVGGMQKAAARYAVGLARRGLMVDFIATSDGPWVRHCEANGVRVRVMVADPKMLAATIKTLRPHVIHQHVSGYDPDGFQYKAYEEVRRHQTFRVIESNVFGRLDDEQSARWVDFRFFKSMTSLISANRRAGNTLSMASLEKQSVLYNPVVIPDLISTRERQAVRRQLGLDDSHVLVVRVGRPDPVKWADWECRAIQSARQVEPGLRLALIEPPEALRRKIERGDFGAGIITLPLTNDFDWLVQFYQSAEFMLHASFFGESFGYTVAEGMAAGLPVITRSTPYGDNAQVELIENGETGWVCMSVPEMARRMVDLARDDVARGSMGERARVRIHDLAGSETGIGLLEAAIIQVLEGRRLDVLDRKRDAILSYFNESRIRPWRCSEGWRDHAADYASGRIYAAYRLARAKAGVAIKTWGRVAGDWGRV